MTLPSRAPLASQPRRHAHRLCQLLPEYLPFSEGGLHDAASHDNGRTLNELMITGLPCTDPASGLGRTCAAWSATAALHGRRTGLCAAQARHAPPCRGRAFAGGVLRGWTTGRGGGGVDGGGGDDLHPDPHAGVGVQSVPDEPGHPRSTHTARHCLEARPRGARPRPSSQWVEFDERRGFTSRR